VTKPSLTLGHTKAGEPYTTTARDRTTHTHVVGLSGKGKSKFIESLVRQDITDPNEPGVMVMDPHGALYDAILAWCAEIGIGEDGHRKLHLINPSEQKYSFGFNPLHSDPNVSPFTRIDLMVDAFAQVWGGEDTSKTPRLKRCLRAIFFVLVSKGYTLLEAKQLITYGESDMRAMFTEGLDSPIYQLEWDELNSLQERNFIEMFESTNNRLLEFLTQPTICNILGQRNNTINFKECMDNGDIVLVNLKNNDFFSEANALLLGRLLLNDIRASAMTREPMEGDTHHSPFYVYVDECHDYLNGDVRRMLPQTRKFGVHLTLIHQELGQLHDAGEGIASAVLSGAQTKVIFGGMLMEDCKELAENIFASTINLEEGVESSKRNIVVGDYIDIVRGQSKTSGYTESNMTGESTSTPFGEGAESYTSLSNEGSSYTSSTSHSEQEVVRSKWDEVYTDRWSLQEQIFKYGAALKDQPQQHIVVKLPNDPPVHLMTEWIGEALIESEFVNQYEHYLLEHDQFVRLQADVQDEILGRHKQLLEATIVGSEDSEDGFLVDG
jgi:hypothetical protein